MSVDAAVTRARAVGAGGGDETGQKIGGRSLDEFFALGAVLDSYLADPDMFGATPGRTATQAVVAQAQALSEKFKGTLRRAEGKLQQALIRAVKKSYFALTSFEITL